MFSNCLTSGDLKLEITETVQGISVTGQSYMIKRATVGKNIKTRGLLHVEMCS